METRKSTIVIAVAMMICLGGCGSDKPESVAEKGTGPVHPTDGPGFNDSINARGCIGGQGGITHETGFGSGADRVLVQEFWRDGQKEILVQNRSRRDLEMDARSVNENENFNTQSCEQWRGEVQNLISPDRLSVPARSSRRLALSQSNGQDGLWIASDRGEAWFSPRSGGLTNERPGAYHFISEARVLGGRSGDRFELSPSFTVVVPFLPGRFGGFRAVWRVQPNSGVLRLSKQMGRGRRVLGLASPFRVRSQAFEIVETADAFLIDTRSNGRRSGRGLADEGRETYRRLIVEYQTWGADRSSEAVRIQAQHCQSQSIWQCGRGREATTAEATLQYLIPVNNEVLF